ncbi:LETM1 and EF-hand domain-containing protein anon-60Da isoform 2 [Hibiscus syriacus]|uniref:LETM1 and EF-hand domain-containing protein anon-60Da isoform 2 n=1 Tax=Hibiscus syriacus TaxID=106335 RepID=A0A6A3A698_HIBSY|nr:LETM1 and EF-hand domain-containing protein anon-60Da isoform 2 [Hibiscus syriacus]
MFHRRLQGNFFAANKCNLIGLRFAGYTSSKGTFQSAFSAVPSSPPCDPSGTGNKAFLPEVDSPSIEFNRVNCLVWVLHEAARSFSLAVESLELDGSRAEVAMAWNGKDVHQWHKRIAHRVAVYAMLKTVIEVEILLSQEHHNNPSPVRKILTAETGSLEEFIESRLKLRHPELVQWFRVVELPRMKGFFIPLLKKWSMEYAGSGVAGIIMAISCCAAVEKLCSEHISCPMSKISVGDVIVGLMDLSHGIVSVDKLHQLATEAGFETHFLSHFGAKVLASKKSDEIEFWIGLALRKLSVAFTKETVIPGKLEFNSKSCSALGAATWSVEVFSFTRSSLPYQFTNSSWSRSAQQPLDSQLLAFLLQSQRLLSLCLEDYWAAYDRSGEPLKITDSGASKHGPSTGATGSTRFSVALEALAEESQIDEFGQFHLLKKHFCSASKDTVSFAEGTDISKSNTLHQSFIRKCCTELVSSSFDVWLGTQLLFVDLTVSLELLSKQLRGQKVTAREKRKLKRTLNDIATLIPVTILMLLPVSAVGHAAMLAAINKYIPSLIPSPYTSERLDVAKQLKRTKKMEVTSWSNLEDSTS